MRPEPVQPEPLRWIEPFAEMRRCNLDIYSRVAADPDKGLWADLPSAKPLAHSAPGNVAKPREFRLADDFHLVVS
jgi:hypothetical protein